MKRCFESSRWAGLARVFIVLGSTLSLSACFESDSGSEAGLAPIVNDLPGENEVVVGQFLSLSPSASDPQGLTLTFSVVNKPSWAAFDAANGVLSGVPAKDDVGTYANIQVTASNGKQEALSNRFSVVVKDAPGGGAGGGSTPSGNSVPTISGSPPRQVQEGAAYNFTPVAFDADGDPLTFSIQNKPDWASFNTATGQLSGTPPVGSAGSYVDIVISVYDGQVSAGLAAFDIDVSAASTTPPPTNLAPAIGGSAPTAVVEGQGYSFRPSASDPDGDRLSFSISNRPSWATFDTSDGTLSGTPGAGTVGVYVDIRITVSDGTHSTGLPAFSIEVQQAAMGTATLRWTPPSTRTDGTPLTDLAGYRIHYGTSSGNYPNRITIDNPGVTTYMVENLAPATYYFVTTAFDTTGGESDYSNVASKTIP